MHSLHIPGSEWKTRYETQMELNGQLDRQISLINERLGDLRGNPIGELISLKCGLGGGLFGMMRMNWTLMRSHPVTVCIQCSKRGGRGGIFNSLYAKYWVILKEHTKKGTRIKPH